MLIASLFGNGLKFNEIPIQEDGRIKPLDSFARNQLLIFFDARLGSLNLCVK